MTCFPVCIVFLYYLYCFLKRDLHVDKPLWTCFPDAAGITGEGEGEGRERKSGSTGGAGERREATGDADAGERVGK